MEAFNTGRHSFNFSDVDLDKALVNLNDPKWEPATSWESAKPKGSEKAQIAIGDRADLPKGHKRSESSPLGRTMSHLQSGAALSGKEMTTLGKAIASTKSIAKLIPNIILKALPDAFCKKLAAKSIEKTNFAFVTEEFGIKDKKELAELKKHNLIPNNKLLTKDSESEIKGAASELREAKQAFKREAQINGWLKKLANKLGESLPITLKQVRVSDRENPRYGASREDKLSELNDLAQEVGVDKLVKELKPILEDSTVGYVGVYSLSDEVVDGIRAKFAEEQETKVALSGGVQNSAELPEGGNSLAAFEERVSRLPAEALEFKRVVTLLIDEYPFDESLRNMLNNNVLDKLEAGDFDDLSSLVETLRDLLPERPSEAA